MQYFAIGEDNGGAGERRLGPFDTAAEAQAAGQKETKESNGAFVFRGVVDEANNQVGMDIEPVVSTNSVRTTCPVVANAITANRRVVARNGYVIHQYTKGGWYLIGFSGNKNNPLIDDYAGRGEEYIFPSKESAQRFIDSTLKKLKPRGTFSIDEDRGFAFGRGPGKPNMNAVARNADERIAEKFSRSIEGTIYKGDRPSWSVTIYTDGLGSPYSSISAEDCVKKCEDAIRNLDEKKQGLVKAIAWLKKNA